MGNFVFVTSCVESTSERITEMTDIASDMTNHQFIFHAAKEVGIVDEVLAMLGYESWANDSGTSARTLFADDWAMSCHKSWYLGFPCYYVKHSCIEYVFMAVKHANALPDAILDERFRTGDMEELELQWDALEENAILLGVSLSVAAKRFGEGNKELMVRRRIPFQAIARTDRSATLKHIPIWDRQNLK